MIKNLQNKPYLIQVKYNTKFHIFSVSGNLRESFLFYSIIRKCNIKGIFLAIYCWTLPILKLLLRTNINLIPFVDILEEEELPKFIKKFLIKKSSESNYSFFIKNAGGDYKNRVIVYNIINFKVQNITKLEKKKSFFLQKENLTYDFLKKKHFDKYLPEVISYHSNSDFSEISTKFLGKEFNVLRPKNMNYFPKELWSLSKSCSFYELNPFIPPNRNVDWIQFVNKNHSKKFNLLLKSVKEKMIVGFIHGDLTSENIFQDNHGDKKFIDFESSSNFGPYLTDLIGFWLSFNYSGINRNSKKTFNEFDRRFGGFKNDQVIYALFYLSFITGSLEAKKLFKKYIYLKRHSISI